MANKKSTGRKPASSNKNNRTSSTKRMARTQNYIYDSTARRLEPDDEIVRRRKASNYKRRVRARQNQEKALQMGLPSVAMLTIATVCALYICISYLHIQAEMTSKMHNITILEQQLEQLRSENDTLQTKINTDTNLDYVYKVATEELGMVYANSNQVVLYDKTDNEYVRQYDDIPLYK